MKKSHIISLFTALILLITMSYQPPLTNVQAWGIPTHHYTVEIASKLVPETWQSAFSYYSPEVIAGSGYPDQVLQDWDNHLYYPYSGEHHNAPWKINETVYVIRDFAAQQEWENVFFFLGIISHYTADINIPVHTDEYWDGHPAYETDINNHLDDFNASVYDFGNITDPVQFIIDCATYAHQYYWDIRNAYPTGDEYNIVTTNETIKQITEEQLGRAIGAILAIWNFTLQGITPPEISEVEDVATVMIDRAHDNDYATDALTSFTSTLDRDVVRIVYNDDEITPLTLAGVDLLVITAPFSSTGFTENETTAIANWYAAGGHLLLSGRGDYNPVNHQAINALLSAIGSHLRVNDDNVYTTNADPDYYKDWYCNTDEYGTDSVADSIRGPLNRKIQFFSPNSIYSIDNSENVHFLMFGEEY
ncbi:MAG: zinc dependent phospholipase C family protein, partial [Candidatus Heimdallarchaeaceae archaeon]